MPSSGEQTPLLEEGAEMVGRAASKAKGAWQGFTDWVFQDNVLEVAVGLILATAFTKLVNSFVSGMMLPIISLLPFIGRNLGNKFAVLKGGSHYNGDYDNLQAALDDGATVMLYGDFIDKFMNLIGIGLSLYIIGTLYGWLTRDQVIKRKVKCKYCKTWIKESASKCPNCGTWVDGRED